MKKAVGIICEYNPFHNGHKYHIDMIKKMFPDHIIILVLSGYFTERGDISILTKYDKTKLSLEMGIDLVIELPFVFGSQAADIFASGAIQILGLLNVQKLVFGSECDDINLLKKLADVQFSDEYNLLVKNLLKTGVNYPTALSRALKEITGSTVNEPNDLLAISYIHAIKEFNFNIEPICIKRTASYHSLSTNSNIISATAIRNLVISKENVDNYIPYNCKEYKFVSIDNNLYFNLLKHEIITHKNTLNNIQTVDEGIENRLIKYINECNNLNDFILKVKTKRYTYNKIKRMCLHIICNFTKEEANNHKNIEYIRILGLNSNGKDYLRRIKKEISIPIISKLSVQKGELLNIEQRATIIYSMLSNNNDLLKKEYQVFPIVMD